MEALSLPISQPLHLFSLRRILLEHLFCLDLEPFGFGATDNSYQSFFQRYETLCSIAIKKQHGARNTTHAEVLEAVELLRSHTALPRHELIQKIKKEQESSGGDHGDSAIAVLDLSASLWLMQSIGPYEGAISLEQPIPWSEGPLSSLIEWSQIIDSHRGPSYASDDYVKLPQSFTAAQLELTAGIEVRWTSNMADHLRLSEDDTRLSIFHHASILELHKLSPHETFPASLADETLRTIALLIPPVLGQPNSWFVAKTKAAGKRLVDASAGTCHRLNSSDRHIENFAFWRERLILLKRTFDEAEPRTLKQLWHDDRKKTQWFTFWVAVLVLFLTIFFGIVQSAAGIVQAWASVAALNRSAS